MGSEQVLLPGVMFQNLGGIGGAAASASLPGPMGPTGAASKALSFHIIALSTLESSVLIWVGSGCRICGRGGRGECSGSDNGASAEIQWSMQCDVNSGPCACIARIRSGFANHLHLSAYCPAVFGEPSRYPPQNWTHSFFFESGAIPLRYLCSRTFREEPKLECSSCHPKNCELSRQCHSNSNLFLL
jgi:hypothetical protein